MGFIDENHTLKISRRVHVYKYVIASTESSFNRFKTNALQTFFSVDDMKNYNI